MECAWELDTPLYELLRLIVALPYKVLQAVSLRIALWKKIIYISKP